MIKQNNKTNCSSERNYLTAHIKHWKSKNRASHDKVVLYNTNWLVSEEKEKPTFWKKRISIAFCKLPSFSVSNILTVMHI